MDTYEKKYNEAQKWIESIYPELSHEQQMEAEAFFPELQESEDERIRKEMIGFFKGFYDNKMIKAVDVEPWLAWLEKQGEKKPAWSEDDEKRLQSCINILKAKSLMGKVDTANTMWLNSLKQRLGG